MNATGRESEIVVTMSCGFRAFQKVLDVGSQSEAHLKNRQQSEKLDKSNSAEDGL